MSDAGTVNEDHADALVLFGATGDLSRRKLFPALYRLARTRERPVPVLGVAKSGWDDQQLREHAAAAVRAAYPDADPRVLDGLLRSLTMVDGDYRDPATFTALARHLADARRPVCYLAIPPSLFAVVVHGLDAAGLADRTRVVVEKPFGRDLASARALNQTLHAIFPEESIFRIDHYLGKEPVEDLLVFRFANSVFEPIWNRRHIAAVQLTMAESFGVEGRGAFYDSVGAVRDVVQNHLLQVVTLLAMEPPACADAEAMRDEKVKVVRALKPMDPRRTVRGQYAGYRAEPGVAADSAVETFVATRLEIDNWRWAGVPFVVRAGKALAATTLEAVVQFHAPPRLLFAGDDAETPHPNLLRFRLGADDGVTIEMRAKAPGPRLLTKPVALTLDFAAQLGERQAAYERLLAAAIDGDRSRFAREDMVEHAWRAVQPVLDDPPPAVSYPPGSWGPAEADRLLADTDDWHTPPPAGR